MKLNAIVLIIFALISEDGFFESTDGMFFIKQGNSVALSAANWKWYEQEQFLLHTAAILLIDSLT